jgi:hypothetical protein
MYQLYTPSDVVDCVQDCVFVVGSSSVFRQMCVQLHQVGLEKMHCKKVF